MKRSLIALTLALSLVSLSAFSAEKAHRHGTANVSLALENAKQGEVDFVIPGESVFGFERRTLSEKDKAAVEAGLTKIRERAAEIVIFPADAKCAISDVKVEIEDEDHDHGHAKKSKHAEHVEVSGGYKVSCEKELTDAKVTGGLFKILSGVKLVEFQFVSPNAQLKKKLKSADEAIDLSGK